MNPEPRCSAHGAEEPCLTCCLETEVRTLEAEKLTLRIEHEKALETIKRMITGAEALRREAHKALRKLDAVRRERDMLLADKTGRGETKP